MPSFVSMCVLLVGITGCGTTATEDTGLGTIDPRTGCLTFESTFDAIQTLVFDQQGCSADACHGAAMSGNLDLRVGSSYAGLVEAAAIGSARNLVEPGQPDESYLFFKLAAATDPSLGYPIAGSPMPSGAPPISENQLEAIRMWIQAGAPETGSVGDSEQGQSDKMAELLGACLPPATPVTIAPLPPPPADKGIQFRMPSFLLPAETETEVCFAQYYDFSDRIPAEFQDGEVFYMNGSRVRQDPQSHHLTIQHSGLGPEWVTDEAFGEWTCKGGDLDGQSCDPLDQSACGDALCGSEVTDAVACIGFGPPGASQGFLNNQSLGGAGTAQESTPPRDGAYREFPIRGILYWNSHAFNLSREDHSMNARMNVLFTDDLRRELVNATDSTHIYDQAGQPPYTVDSYCADHVVPQDYELLRISSHTHKRGKEFTIALPDGTVFYESLLYNDPVTLEMDPPMLFDALDEADRTLRYCATFNNGVDANGDPDPTTVTRASRMPGSATCEPVACAAGNIGAPCAGEDDDAACDSSPGAGDGWCDACAIAAGVTTEHEMFVLTPTYLLP